MLKSYSKCHRKFNRLLFWSFSNSFLRKLQKNLLRNSKIKKDVFKVPYVSKIQSVEKIYNIKL